MELCSDLLRNNSYDYYSGPPNNWTKEQVDINLFTRYSADMTQFSAFDRKSIMLYPIPNAFTEGDFEVGWNRTLSTTDKRYIAKLYPGVAKHNATAVHVEHVA